MESQVVDIHLSITTRTEVRVVVSRFGELETSFFEFRIEVLLDVSQLGPSVGQPLSWIWIEATVTDVGIILKEQLIMSCRVIAFECTRNSHPEGSTLCGRSINK